MKLFIGILLLCCLLWLGSIAFIVVPSLLTEQDTVTIAREAWDEINEYREEAGRDKLVWDDELAHLAIEHSQWMKDTGNYRHSKYPFSYAENILEGGFRLTGEPIAKLWKESTAHNIIMMDRYIQSGAVGVVGEYATFMAK